MTNEAYPITPPPELVQEWKRTAPHQSNEHEHYHYITLCAAQWGADQELEACCEWLGTQWLGARTEGFPAELRDARRPKPPNLKDLALSELETILNELHRANGSILTASAIRRALERLKQLEDSND